MTEQGSILARTAKGAGWVVAWRMVTRSLGMVSTIILTHLLLPGDFGLVMIATAFGQVVNSFSTLGVEEAVIRIPNPTRELYDSAFTLNVIRGVATSAIVAAAAWPGAVFFHDMRLVPVVLAFAATGLVGSFENIGIVEFRRDIAFHKEFLLMSVPRLVSVIVALTAAYILRSYWALVIALIASSLLRLALGYIIHPFRPRFGLRAWRQIASFSAWTWAISIVALARDRGDDFVVGRELGTGKVGVYLLGAEIANMPISELVAPLARAAFSAFAAARHDDRQDETVSTYLRIVGAATLIALPAGVGLSLIADPLVKVALGANWSEAAPVMQLLSIALCITIPGTISRTLLNAQAVLRSMFVLEFGSAIVRIALLIVLVMRFGVIGAALGVAIASFIDHAGYLVLARRQLALRWRDMLAPVWRSVAAGAVMASGLWWLGLGWAHAPDFATALATLERAVPLGAALHIGAQLLLWLACGRPAGAERDVIDMAARVLRGARRRLSRS